MARKHKPTDSDTSENGDTQTFVCAQRGCKFEADEAPETCPVCGHPFFPHPDPDAAHVE